MTGMSESTRTDTVIDPGTELVGADRRAVVITSSSRAAAGVYPDRSGPVIVDRLQSWGFATGAPIVRAVPATVATGAPVIGTVPATVATRAPVVRTVAPAVLAPATRGRAAIV